MTALPPRDHARRWTDTPSPDVVETARQVLIVARVDTICGTDRGQSTDTAVVLRAALVRADERHDRDEARLDAANQLLCAASLMLEAYAGEVESDDARQALTEFRSALQQYGGKNGNAQ